MTYITLAVLAAMLLLITLSAIKRKAARDYDQHRFRGVGRPTDDPRNPLTRALRERAAQKGGNLSLSDVIMTTGYGLRQAELYMGILSKEGHAVRATDERGAVQYRFRDLS